MIAGWEGSEFNEKKSMDRIGKDRIGSGFKCRRG